MTTIEGIMTRDVQTLEPDISLREAGERLAADGVSGAPVVAGTRVVGVVSLSDLIDFHASTPGVPSHRDDGQEWGEFTSADRMDDEVSDPPSGYFVDLWADSGGDVRERFGLTDGPEWDLLSEHTVAEVMTRNVVALGPEASVKEAAELMVNRGIHRILVLQGDELVGIVTTTDVMRAVADGRIS
jgi:CBS domain-containing protein